MRGEDTFKVEEESLDELPELDVGLRTPSGDVIEDEGLKIGEGISRLQKVDLDKTVTLRTRNTYGASYYIVNDWSPAANQTKRKRL